MRKLAILAVIIIILLLAAPALAAPKNKKKPPGLGGGTTSGTTPTTTTSSTPTTDNGTNWEMVGAIVAILAFIGAGVGWFLSHRARSATGKYLKQINKTTIEYKSDTAKCEAALYAMKERIENEYGKGKINDQSYAMLDARIDKQLSKVRRGMVDTLEISPKARKELDKMLADGKISDEEYESFKLSDIFSSKDKREIGSIMRKWKSKDIV